MSARFKTQGLSVFRSARGRNSAAQLPRRERADQALWWPAILIAVVATTFGCGTAPPNGGGTLVDAKNGSPDVVGSETTPFNQWVNALCSGLAKCDPPFAVHDGRPFANMEICVSSMVNWRSTDFDPGLASGAIQMHPVEFAKCLSEMSTNCRTESPSSTPSCEVALSGTRLIGDRCANHYECAKGYCKYEIFASGCLGRCTPGITAGTPCNMNDGDPCEPPLHCSGGKCVATAFGGESGACYDDWQCAPTSYCSNNVCTPRSPPGGACESVGACPSGQYCRFSAAKSFCTDITPPGFSCTDSSECDDGHACWMETEGTGICKPLSALGGPCSDSGFPCGLAGLTCSSGTCQLDPGLGDACVDQSGGHLWCRGETYCDGSVCAARLPLGAKCDSFWACASGLFCTHKNGVPRTCAALPGPGSFCEGYECAPGAVCDGKFCISCN